MRHCNSDLIRPGQRAAALRWRVIACQQRWPNRRGADAVNSGQRRQFAAAPMPSIRNKRGGMGSRCRLLLSGGFALASGKPCNSPPARRRSVSACPGAHIQEGALVGSALAHVGVAVRTEHIDGAGDGLLVGTLSRYQRHAWLYLIAHAQDQTDGAAVVEEADALAILEVAGSRLIGMQDAAGRTLPFAHKRDGRKRRMALEITGGGEQSQRPAPAILLLLLVWLPIRQRRQALAAHGFGIELELARRGTEGLARRRRNVDRTTLA